MTRPRVSDRFPDFPWDTIADAKARAAAHPDGIVDLSIGTPVDDSPRVAQDALVAAANSPGYPTVWGPVSLRQAAADWMTRRTGAVGVTADHVLPVIGTKELIANLPQQLGLGPDDVVVHPALAYPTYAVGAEYTRSVRVEADHPDEYGDVVPSLIYLNSPANPHGRILSAQEMADVVAWAREHGSLVVSDECYLEFAWDAEPVSVLDPAVCGGSFENVLVLHSLSKRSNLAGYRDAFVAGDPAVVKELLDVRKHLGFMLPTPIARAMEAALADDAHVDAQRALYARRRADLRAALEGAGFTIEHSEGSLYLWATRGEHGRATLDWLADRGILVAPGDFYGDRGRDFVRVGFMATDERVAAAVARLRP